MILKYNNLKLIEFIPSMIQISLGMIIIASMYQQTLILYGDYPLENFNPFSQEMSGCFFILFIIYLPFFNLNQRNLKDTSIITLKSYKQVIIPVIRNIHQNQEQDFIKLIQADCPLDIVIQAVIDPQKFQDDQINIIKFRIQKVAEGFISSEKRSILKRQIEESTFNKLNNIQTLNDELSIKSYMKLIKDTFIDILMHIDLKDKHSKLKFNYIHFLKKLNEFLLLYEDIKADQMSTETIDIMREVKSLNRRSVKFSESFKSNFFIDYQNNSFDQTNFCAIGTQIGKMFTQTKVEDKLLAKSYFHKVSQQTSRLKITKDDTHDLSTENIWSQLESVMKITRDKSTSPDQPSQLEVEPKQFNKVSIRYVTRIVEDKLLSNINNKLDRKQQEIDSSDYPYFEKLIKDCKRLSLVFDKIDDLLNFIKKLKQTFGFKFENTLKLNNDASICIREIKNSFCEKIKDANNQKDLKIIFEVKHSEDLVFTIECQCNIYSLIKWKVADHIFYDFTRAKENQEEMRQRWIVYNHMEGWTRKVFRSLQQLVFLILSVFVIQLISNKIFEQYRDKDKIDCQNTRNNCLAQCLKNDSLSNPLAECNHFINKFDQNENDESNHLQNQQFKQQCEKFREDSEIGVICFKKLDLANKFGFLSQNSNSNICYQRKPNYVKCFKDTTNIDYSKFKQRQDKIKSFKKIFISEDKQAVLNSSDQISDYQNNSKISQIEEYLKYLYDSKTLVLDLQFSENRVCALSTLNKLYCSTFRMNFNNDHFDVGHLHICIVIMGKIKCATASSMKQLSKQDDDNISNIIKIRVGWLTNCSLTKYGNLNCWGPNVIFKNFPREWITNVKDFVVENFIQGLDIICVVRNDEQQTCLQPNGDQYDLKSIQKDRVSKFAISCFQMCLLYQNDKVKCMDVDKEKIQIPDEMKANISDIAVGYGHICVVNHEYKIQCTGELKRIDAWTVPDDIAALRVFEVKTGAQHTCVQASNFKIRCFGENSYGESDVKTKAKIFSCGRFSTCQIEGWKVQCFGQVLKQQDVMSQLDSINDLLQQTNYSKDQNEIVVKKIEESNVESFELSYDDDVSQVKMNQAQEIVSIKENPDENNFMIDKIDKVVSKNLRKVIFKNNFTEKPRIFDIKDKLYCLNIYDFCQVPNNSDNKIICENVSKIFEFSDKPTIIIDHIKSEQEETSHVPVVEIRCGQSRVCGLFADKTLKCDGRVDRLGLNMLDHTMSTDVEKMQVGEQATCVMRTDRRIICNGTLKKTLEDYWYDQWPLGIESDSNA